MPPREDVWERRRVRKGNVFGRVLVALLSVVVLSGTGVGWAMLHGPGGGLNTNDVIGAGFSAPDGAMDVLLVGNDSRTDFEGNPLPEELLKKLRATDDEGGDLTDTMILIRIPNDGQRATAVSFPRDTLVDLGEDFGEAKLNSALGRAKAQHRQQLEQNGVTDPKQLERESIAAGQKFLIKTIEQFGGVSIDHYAEVNLLGFHDITEAVGGVDVCLKAPVNDSDYSGAVFPAGPQTIKGADALAFVRQRHGLPRQDLDRVVRQQVFMSGLAQKMLSTGTLSNPAKLSGLFDAVKKAVVLDQGWDVISFAEQMQGIAAGNIEFNTIPVSLEGPSGEEDVVADVDEVQQYVDDLLLPPKQRQAQQQKRQATEAQRSETTVDVYNASGATGLAGRVLETLTGDGFAEGTSGNAESMPSSVIYHAPGDDPVAKQVAETLGGLPTEVKGSLPPGTVEVYVGADYAGPGAQNFAGNQAVRLDGLQRSEPFRVQDPQEPPPITANGVPCIN